VELDRESLSASIRRLLGNGQRDAHNILITPHLGAKEAGQLRLLLNTGVSVMVVALSWNEDDDQDQTMAIAASLGCQVTSVRPGQDLTTALYNSVGAGNRI
jgi:hypothetical protein